MAETETEVQAPPSPPEPPPEPARVLAEPVAPTKPRRAGLIGPALGGVIAAGLGYGVAQYVPNGWHLQDTAALQAALTAQQQETAALKAQLADLAARPAPQPAPDSALQDRITALESATPPAAVDLAPLEARITELEARLTAIEAMPVTGAAPSAAALAAQKAAADAVLKQAEDTAAKIKADAEASARQAEARAALGRVQAALDSGAAYASALPALGDLPAVLKDNAATGLPTLASLQESFPAAARTALEAALRANMGESWSDRVTSFLRTQTGARSLAPRDGSDPDAVLSRAEAALGAGDLQTALTELATLPPEAQTALTDWRAQAETRAAAMQAVAQLAAAME